MMDTLNATGLREAFSDLAERLHKQSVHARLYIAGGAAMALAYDENRLTRDVDAAIEAGWDEVTTAAHAIAAERGWPASWLKEQATAYMPPPAGRCGRVVFEHANLTVCAASPEQMLAMKARSARRVDEADFAVLLSLTGLDDAAAVIELAERVIPGAPLSPRQIRWIEHCLTAAGTSGLACEPPDDVSRT
ncbi:nucleotidyl transferase [Candidatus Poriferisodalis sp.]|uniref:nucleotidyl transferase n=1 Tax=Candidatus Poriferisodalis sp. TaxID=3101277 RepID=UPI003B0180E0